MFDNRDEALQWARKKAGENATMFGTELTKPPRGVDAQGDWKDEECQGHRQNTQSYLCQDVVLSGKSYTTCLLFQMSRPIFLSWIATNIYVR